MKFTSRRAILSPKPFGDFTYLVFINVISVKHTSEATVEAPDPSGTKHVGMPEFPVSGFSRSRHSGTMK
jgi:hypothetical protein